MDNLPVHHAKTVETLIKSFGVNVKFLPPYPRIYHQLNCQESKITGIMRNDAARSQRLLMPRSPKQSMGLQMKMLSTGLIMVVSF